MPSRKKLRALNDLNPLNILFNLVIFRILEDLTDLAERSILNDVYNIREKNERIIMQKSNLEYFSYLHIPAVLKIFIYPKSYQFHNKF